MHLILAANRAVAEDVGIIAVFGGLGVVVNVLLIYIAIQVRGEYQQNREHLAQLMRRGRS